jgi:serine/threonine protein kinase
VAKVLRTRRFAIWRESGVRVGSHFAADPERLARFDREAKSLAALSHPNIAQVYDLDTSAHGDVGPFLVMELVDGPTLADRLQQGPQPLAEAPAVARQIAEALEAADAHGIVHRDLKPANIKVPDEGAEGPGFRPGQGDGVGCRAPEIHSRIRRPSPRRPP